MVLLYATSVQPITHFQFGSNISRFPTSFISQPFPMSYNQKDLGPPSGRGLIIKIWVKDADTLRSFSHLLFTILPSYQSTRTTKSKPSKRVKSTQKPNMYVWVFYALHSHPASLFLFFFSFSFSFHLKTNPKKFVQLFCN